MKIAILLLNQGRGSGVVAKEHTEFLIKQGHQIHFMHPGIGEGVSGAKNLDINLPSQIMPVHEYLPAAGSDQKAVSHMSYQEAAEYLPAYEKALEEIIDETDLIIGHHANLSAIAVQQVARKHRKPYVLFLHGTGIEPRHHGHYDEQIWHLIQESIERADGIIATTEYVRDELVRSLVPLPLDRFLIQPCGVDIQQFHQENTGSVQHKYGLPSTYVICPGALTRVKGPQNVVEASISYADLAPTVFIGDGELKDELSTTLGDRGTFLGFVSHSDKAQLINAATLLAAAPEKKEHFGIIYVEALAASTPIVAYEGGGVHSIVTSETGILTERDPGALGKTVRDLLQDPLKLEEMKVACRQRAENLYATDLLGPRLSRWLEKLHNQE